MTEVLFNGNGVISLGSIDGKEDLEPRPGININPPPDDGRCQCCGRPLDELKPFGKAGDPLARDFSGALLVQKFRPTGPPDGEAEKIIEKFHRNCRTQGDYKKAREKLIQKYGEEKARELELSTQVSGLSGASWECRGCIVLDTFGYFEQLKSLRST